MSAQDLKQRARELLAAEYRIRKPYRAGPVLRGNLTRYEEAAIRAIVAALRQQPSPVDLEQFRDACYWMKAHGSLQRCAEADRLLSIIDNAGKVEPACEVRLWDSQWVNIVNAPEVLDASDREEAVNAAVRMTERAIAQNVASSNLPPAPHQPAPVVDAAMVDAAMGASAGGYLVRECWFSGEKWARELMRAALTAALARAKGDQS